MAAAGPLHMLCSVFSLRRGMPRMANGAVCSRSNCKRHFVGIDTANAELIPPGAPAVAVPICNIRRVLSPLGLVQDTVLGAAAWITKP